jgi:CheY-like chemotaxis protein
VAVGILSGRTILVVEDEILIAFDIEMELQALGANVVIRPSIVEALVAAAGTQFDAAILDLAIRGGDVYPVADRLRAEGVPFVFHTGHGEETELTARYPESACCRKPCAEGTLPRLLLAVMAGRRADARSPFA